MLKLKCYSIAALICLSASFDVTASELLEMLSEDQKVRDKIYTLPKEKVKDYINDVMIPTDKVRKARVIEIMSKEPDLNADEFFAAAMIMQHGSTADDAKLAMEYARKAVGKNANHNSAKWLTCASEDRYLVRSGKAQIWGTQLSRKKHPTAEYEILYLENFDRQLKTDEQRKQCYLPSYAEIDNRLKKMRELPSRSEQLKLWKKVK